MSWSVRRATISYVDNKFGGIWSINIYGYVEFYYRFKILILRRRKCTLYRRDSNRRVMLAALPTRVDASTVSTAERYVLDGPQELDAGRLSIWGPEANNWHNSATQDTTLFPSRSIRWQRQWAWTWTERLTASSFRFRYEKKNMNVWLSIVINRLIGSKHEMDVFWRWLLWNGASDVDELTCCSWSDHDEWYVIASATEGSHNHGIAVKLG